MFGSKNEGTVIAKGLKIVGSVTAEGLVEVHGQIDGELHGTSLVVAKGSSCNWHHHSPTDRRRWNCRGTNPRRRGDPKIARERYRRYSA